MDKFIAELTVQEANVEAKLAKAHEMWLKQADISKTLGLESKNLKDKEAKIAQAALILEDVKMAQANLDQKLEALDSKLARVQAAERSLEAKTVDTNKQAALFVSREAALAERENKASTLIEKYKFAMQEIQDKEQSIKLKLGEVLILEDRAKKSMAEAETILSSANQKELEVLAQWARIKKVINDKNIENAIKTGV
jgi:DNA repair exonuclease SbcCD ATPase subunit